MFVERYPELAGQVRLHPRTATTGPIWPGLTAVTGEPGRFTILFAGSLYRPGELDAFLAASSGSVARRPDLRSRLRVQFVGRASSGNRRLADQYTPRSIGDVVRFEGFVPARSAARMAGGPTLSSS